MSSEIFHQQISQFLCADEFVEIPHQYEQLVPGPLYVTKEAVIYINGNFKIDYTI